MRSLRYLLGFTATLVLSSNASLAIAEEFVFDLSVLSDDYAQATLNDSKSSLAIKLPYKGQSESASPSEEGIVITTYECTGFLNCTYSRNGIVVDTISELCQTISPSRCQANCNLSITVDGVVVQLSGSSGSCTWREVLL